MLRVDTYSERVQFSSDFPKLIIALEDALNETQLVAPRALKNRTLRWLKKQGIYVLGQVASHTEKNLLRYKNIGWKSIKLIKEMLALYDLHLGTYFTEEQYETLKHCAGILENYRYHPYCEDYDYLVRLLTRDRDANLSPADARLTIKLVEQYGWVRTQVRT